MLRRTLVVALAVVLGGSALAVAAKPGPGGKTHTLSLAAAPNTVVFGHAATLSGTLTGANNAGVTITLRANPYPFTAARDAGTVKTNAAGAFTFSVRPAAHTRYTVEAHPKGSGLVRSAEVLVRVRKGISFHVSTTRPARGARVRFYGQVTPAHDGLEVRIQRRRANGTWATLTRTKLTHVAGANRSNYSVRAKVSASGAYRAVVVNDPDHLAAGSRPRNLVVH
jgi:hypothetical protein